YRLARLHFQKGQLEEALSALARIEGRIPEAIRDDIELLRANVQLAMGRPELAIETLERLDAGSDLVPFVAYNLGIAWRESGSPAAAFRQVDVAGRGTSDDPAAVALRDKANLVVGTMLLETGRYDAARTYFDRVHLEGPYSTRALLSS